MVGLSRLQLLAVLVNPVAGFGVISNVSLHAVGRERSKSSSQRCTCDCCVAELQRDENPGVTEGFSLLQCAYDTSEDQGGSSASSAGPRCGSTCLRSSDDHILDSPELDTQRFCFMECEPVVAASRPLLQAAPGDPCGPLTRAEALEVNDGKGDALRPPNEAPGVLNHFLTARRTRTDSEQPVASAPAPAPAVAASSAPLPAGPWASISPPALAQGAKIAAWTQQARQVSDLAAKAVLNVGMAAKKAGASLAAAAGAAVDAQRAAERAQAAERRVRSIRDALRRRTHQAALDTVPLAVNDLRQQARAIAKANALKLKSFREAQMKALAPHAAFQAMQPYEAARDSAAVAEQRYLNEGDRLAQVAAMMQEAAHDARDSANELLAAGAETEATRIMNEAKAEMAKANKVSEEASAFYASARSIAESLPAYERGARDAGYRAAVLVYPDAQPPLPALALSQQPRLVGARKT
eukprot:TRINITY_DN22622_c0_g1_i2.p1 TRINITY_DN22622_c0_g1~~TRINITY_DN22622_c0_g1_i2.p1  ORF type:complete len:489 (+),score=80.68 TRINITY_DN22622_c0_g1_i2:65-1468(+)